MAGTRRFGRVAFAAVAVATLAVGVILGALAEPGRLLPGRVLLGIAGAASLLLAGWLLTVGGDHRPTRAYAYLLILGGSGVFLAYATAPVGGGLAAQAARTAPYLLIPIPFVVAYLVAVFPRPRAPWMARPAFAWALIGAVLAVEAAYLLDHTTYVTRGQPGVTGLTRLLEPLVVGTAALVLARDHALGRAGAGGASVALLAAALVVDPYYSVGRDLVFTLFGSGPTTFHVAWILAGVPCTAAAVLLLRRSLAAQGRSRRFRRAVPAWLLFAPPAIGAVAAGSVLTWPGAEPLIAGVSPALLGLASALMGAYALARRHLVDADLRAKQGIRQGTVVTVFLAMVVLANQGASLVLPGEGAALLGLLAAGVLVLAIARLQGLAERVAEGALPRVAASEEHLSARKIEVYRAALEQAVADGVPSGPRGSAILVSLRRELGLTDRDHALLEHAVRAGASGEFRPPARLEAGAEVLGRFRVRRALGEGAHGSTYLAEDTQLRRDVVIKMLHPEKAGDPSALQEARAISRIRHPNVVTVYDVERVGDRGFIVMEHVEGGSLEARLRRGPLPPAAFAVVARGLLEALAAVHAQGLVHRDVKPSNVLLTAKGEAKLADFGVAHQPGLETTAGGSGGAAVGTVRFMSPEQARGRRVTARSDQYSAGATLYEAWTGKPYLAPLPGESAVEVQMRAASAGPFRAPLDGPPALQAWFARALHPSPERRFASAEAMRDALRAALQAP